MATTTYNCISGLNYGQVEGCLSHGEGPSCPSGTGLGARPLPSGPSEGFRGRVTHLAGQGQRGWEHPSRGGCSFRSRCPPLPSSSSAGALGQQEGQGRGLPPESTQPPQGRRAARGLTLSKHTRFSCPQMLILWGLMQKIPTFLSRRCA